MAVIVFQNKENVDGHFVLLMLLAGEYEFEVRCPNGMVLIVQAERLWS